MQKFRIKVEVMHGKIIFSLGCACTDVTLYWRDMFKIADLIGKSAIRLNASISDPTQDEEESRAIQIRRFRKEYAVLCFNRTDRFIWTPQVAWNIANRMCKACEVFAKEHNDRLEMKKLK